MTLPDSPSTEPRPRSHRWLVLAGAALLLFVIMAALLMPRIVRLQKVLAIERAGAPANVEVGFTLPLHTWFDVLHGWLLKAQESHPFMGWMRLITEPITENHVQSLFFGPIHSVSLGRDHPSNWPGFLAEVARLNQVTSFSVYTLPTRLSSTEVHALAAELSRHPEFESLYWHMSRHTLNDAELATLAKIPTMTTLRMTGCDVTDAGFTVLARHPTLRSIDIRAPAHQFPKERQEALRKALPGLFFNFILR